MIIMRFNLSYLIASLLLPVTLTGQQGTEDGTLSGDNEFVQKYIVHDERSILAVHPYEEGLHENRVANLFFGKDDFRIRPDLSTNRIPMVNEHLDLLFRPPGSGWEVDTVAITAYASPEGDSLYNRTLAEKRARAGIKYIQGALRSAGIDKQSYIVLTEITGEDWAGLVRILRASDLEGKDEILKIIEDQHDTDKELNDLLKEPQLSETIKVNFLPLLRRINIRIHYREPVKTDQELLEMALSQPGKLRYSQLMHAATLAGNQEEQLKIYQGACTHYPEEWKAFNNAACIYLAKDQPEKAVVYLNQASNLFPQNGTILNNMAAASLKLMRPDKALHYLELAEKEGVDVMYNQGIGHLLAGNYDEAWAVLKNHPCRTNSGLAAMMSGQSVKAAEQFICSPQTATSLYLAARCEARTGNEAALRQHLEKAIQLDAGLIQIIRNENEFLPYNGSAWFQQILSH